MTLKTLKDFTDEPCQDVAPASCEGRKRLKEEIREAAKEWRDKLNETLKKACEKQEDVYNDAELEIEGVIYEASAFEDDEAKPIIKFIKQFFNLEGEDK